MSNDLEGVGRGMVGEVERKIVGLGRGENECY